MFSGIEVQINGISATVIGLDSEFGSSLNVTLPAGTGLLLPVSLRMNSLQSQTPVRTVNCLCVRLVRARARITGL